MVTTLTRLSTNCVVSASWVQLLCYVEIQTIVVLSVAGCYPLAWTMVNHTLPSPTNMYPWPLAFSSMMSAPFQRIINGTQFIAIIDHWRTSTPHHQGLVVGPWHHQDPLREASWPSCASSGCCGWCAWFGSYASCACLGLRNDSLRVARMELDLGGWGWG